MSTDAQMEVAEDGGAGGGGGDGRPSPPPEVQATKRLRTSSGGTPYDFTACHAKNLDFSLHEYRNESQKFHENKTGKPVTTTKTPFS